MNKSEKAKTKEMIWKILSENIIHEYFDYQDMNINIVIKPLIPNTIINEVLVCCRTSSCIEEYSFHKTIDKTFFKIKYK
jgi:hypothetical protein